MGWLDLLKAVSAFAVVMTHIASIGWQAMEPGAPGWFVTSVYEIVTRFAVPAFFMATGALLLNPRRQLSLRRVLGSYVPRTALIALSVSFLYCTLERLLYGWQGWKAVVRAALDGPYFMWYLWVLVGLYLLVPVLRLIARNAGTLVYTLVILALFVMGKSTAEAMLPQSWLTVWLDNFILFTSGMEGVFYCLLGALLVRLKLTRFQGGALLGAGILALCLAIGLNYRSALLYGADLYYVARDNVLVAIFSIGVFELFHGLDGRLRSGGWIGRIAGWGMTIYLVHPFFRLAMEGVGFFSPAVTWLLDAPAIAIPVVSLAMWLLSAAVGAVIDLIAEAARNLLAAREPRT